VAEGVADSVAFVFFLFAAGPVDVPGEAVVLAEADALGVADGLGLAAWAGGYVA
jgi:hypothetical protein